VSVDSAVSTANPECPECKRLINENQMAQHMARATPNDLSRKAADEAWANYQYHQSMHDEIRRRKLARRATHRAARRKLARRATHRAAEENPARPPGSEVRDVQGRYDYSTLERRCRCGHALGNHLGGGRRPCSVGQNTAIGGPVCSCPNFRATKEYVRMIDANPASVVVTPRFSKICITVPHGNPFFNDTAAPFVGWALAEALKPVAKVPVYFAANIIDRIEGDMNREETRPDPWRQQILALCDPGTLLLDVHSFPPTGGSGRFTGYDVVGLTSNGRSPRWFLDPYMADLGLCGFKVGIMGSEEPNDVVESAAERGAVGLLVEHSEKFANRAGGEKLAAAHMTALKRWGVW